MGPSDLLREVLLGPTSTALGGAREERRRNQARETSAELPASTQSYGGAGELNNTQRNRSWTSVLSHPSVIGYDNVPGEQGDKNAGNFQLFM